MYGGTTGAALNAGLAGARTGITSTANAAINSFQIDGDVM
jgi:hypothetical protein